MRYLDYAADTPPCEAAIAAFVEAGRAFPANPNSTHAMGISARERMDAAAAGIAAHLHVKPEELVFTSGATESNNLAILGAARAYQSRGRHLISTPMEHPSVTEPLMVLREEGFEVDFLEVGGGGRVDLEQLRRLLRPDTILVSVCAVDAEIGVVQPVTELAAILDEFPHCRLHVDATQAVGKLRVPLNCADLISFSPHKFYGLCGSGALAVRGGMRLSPIFRGGSGGTPYRSGTPAVALAVAMQAALDEAMETLEERLSAVSRLNYLLREGLQAMSFVTINSPGEASPYLLNFSVSGVRAQVVLSRMSDAGFCLSSKSACCAPSAPSRPVLAMTGSRNRAMNTIRVSLSHLNSDEDVAAFLAELPACVRAAGGDL